MTNEEEFREWLEGQPREVCVAIAYRSAMRVLPLAMDLDRFESSERVALATLRANLSAGVVAACPTSDVIDELKSATADSARSADQAALSVVRADTADAARAVADAASSAAFVDSGRANGAGHVTGATGGAAISGIIASNGNPAAYFDGPTARPVHAVVIEDTERDLTSLMQIANTVPSDVSEVIDRYLKNGRSALTAGGPWAFWAEWYQRAMEGDPIDWKLQEQIALIPDEVWEAGVDAVAYAIARIEAEFDLRDRIAEFEAGIVVGEEARLGIGGNSPPEEIDDTFVAEQMVLIRGSVAGLKEEIEAEEADAGIFSRLVEQIGAALTRLRAWIGKRFDRSVDVCFALGINHLYTNPALVEAVWKSAKVLLPFLAP